MCCGSEPSQQQTNTYLSSSSMRTMTLPFRVTEGRPVLKEDAEALRVFLDAIGSVPPLHFTKKVNDDEPFLRNINEPTNFSFSSSMARGTKGPIFEDGPNFDMAFRRFHGQNDVVPLSEGSLQFPQTLKVESMSHQFNPLAAKAATISLSSYGGPFSFDEMFRKEDMETKVSTYQDIQIKMICRFIYDHSGVVPVSQQLNGVAVRHAIISLFGSEGPFGASNEMSKEQQKSLNKVDSSEITVEPMYRFQITVEPKILNA
ncbi:hypothetical protein Lser_V15G44335 [Lactuca serriola]